MQERSGRAAAAILLTGLATIAMALPMVAQRNRLGFDFWPDIVCQLFVGWRVAEGDALYTTIWESHPPAAVLVAALPHFVLEPGLAAGIGLIVALAVAVFVINLAFLRALVRAPWFVGGACAFLTAAFFYRYLIGARSEDVMMLCGPAALAAAAFGSRARSSTLLPMLSGAIAGFGMLAKPGAIAAGTVAFLIVACCSERPWRAMGSFFAGAALPVLAVVLWLGGEGIAGAYKNVVVYGKAYFKPLDDSTFAAFLGRLAERPLPALIAAYGTAVVVLGPWLFTRVREVYRALRRWQAGVLFGLVFVLWPLLELAVILPQTTLFSYVFFPLMHALLLLSLAGVSVMPGVVASAFGNRRLALAAAAAIALLSLGALVGIAAVGHGHWRGVVATIQAGDFLPRAIQQNGQTAALLDAAAHVRAEQRRWGGEVLWFDAAPSVAYFAAARNVIPEYLSHPLFLPGFASEEPWRRVERVLDEEVTVVLVWPEWYNVLNPTGTSAESFAAGTANRLAERFVKVRDLSLYPGRQPVQMLVSTKARRSGDAGAN